VVRAHTDGRPANEEDVLPLIVSGRPECSVCPQVELRRWARPKASREASLLERVPDDAQRVVNELKFDDETVDSPEADSLGLA
jgi:hypothetical protein